MTLIWLVMLGAASIVLHDELGALSEVGLTRPGLVAGLTLGSLLLTWLGAWALVARCGRLLDRKGSFHTVLRAERIVAWARGLGACLFLGATQGLGWPSAVRALVGNPILVDEALAMLPLVGLAAALWHAIEPIESRTANASLMRRLDSGEPLYPHVGRAAFVWMEIRHGVLPSLAPTLLLLGWTETLARGASAGPDWMREWLAHSSAMSAARFVGAGLILLAVPTLQRHILPTTPIGPGALRDSLTAMSDRHGVRLPHLLIWRTRGRLAGASVIGVLPRVRAVVISDVLLESLSQRQVEAVAAHEVGHIRHRHILWWSISLIALVQWVRLAARGAARATAGTSDESWSVVFAATGAMILGLLAFGWVSRRFEWQADAFAAQHLSGHAARAGALAPPMTPQRITPEATLAMSTALRQVARINGSPTSAFGWRHGSVERRAANLDGLRERPVHDLPIDHLARRIKVASAAALIVALILLQR